MGKKEATPPPKPSTTPSASDPANKPKQDCPKEDCWKQDCEKNIAVNSCGRYHRNYKADGSEINYTFNKTFKLLAPVKTGTKVTVEVKFKAETDAGVTAEAATAAKSKLENGVNTYWNNKFTLEADDPECGKKSFKIEYKIVWVDSGQDYTIKIHDTYPRAGLTGKIMDVAKDTSDWVYAHEFGHCVGLPDEYSYSAETESVKYIKPDGSLDAAVSAPPFKPKADADATIMSSFDNTTILKRHAWNIAIETQALLTASIGRNIKCTIT